VEGIAKTGDRLAGFGDAFHNPVGPLRLDADDHHRGHIGIGAGSDKSAKEQFQVFAELQAPVCMGKCFAAFGIEGHFLAS